MMKAKKNSLVFFLICLAIFITLTVPDDFVLNKTGSIEWLEFLIFGISGSTAHREIKASLIVSFGYFGISSFLILLFAVTIGVAHSAVMPFAGAWLIGLLLGMGYIGVFSAKTTDKPDEPKTDEAIDGHRA